MKCNVNGARQQRLIEAYQAIGKSILAYLDASTGCIVSDLYGFKKKRLQEMYDTTHHYIGYMMDNYAEEKDDNRQRAANALKKCKEKLLEYADFDFEGVTASLPPDDDFSKTWHEEADVHKHATRVKLLASMEPVVQTYHAQMLHWFWLHKAFGKERLTKLYTLLRQDYNLYVTEYLRCKAAGDAKIQDMLKSRQDRLEAIGMEFMEV